MPLMLRRFRIGLLLLIGLGCGELMVGSGQLLIQEISPEEARRRIAENGALLLQPRPLGPGESAIAGAVPVFEGDPHETWVDAPELVILGTGDAAWALAARLAREGERSVAISPGNPEAWPGPRSARKESAPGI